MSISIIKPGIQDTIQDAGRKGYQSYGINPTGAMDVYAMQIANALVGNKPETPVIEMHFPASVYLFNEPALIAVTGADFSPSINGEPVPVLHPIAVVKNDVLQFHRPVTGARTYLAVRGGFGANRWLNSASTHLRARRGGFEGRALQKNDEISIVEDRLKPGAFSAYKVFPWKADPRFLPGEETNCSENEIFVLPGREWERMTTEAKENFTMTSFVVTQQSDRMGYRLDNIPLPAMFRDELLSTAVCFGTVQLLPDGKLIVLMADHQTTGGYPRIAHAISAHHHRLAQIKAGDKLQFTFTTQDEAERLFRLQQRHLRQLQDACTLRLQEYFNAK